MSDFLLSSGVATYISQDILIVPFQADFYVEVVAAFQQDILLQLHRNSTIKGLIIDLSKDSLLDFQNMHVLEQTLDMAAMFGVIGFLVGIQPNVTLALIELGYEQKHLCTALTIERATTAIHLALNKLKTVDIHCETDEESIAKMEEDDGG